jgi:hypothetical protein
VRFFILNLGSITLVASGFGWLGTDVYVIARNVILRETWVGIVARFLDKLPGEIANPIFILLWVALLLGWTVPLVLGFRLLLRRKS